MKNVPLKENENFMHEYLVRRTNFLMTESRTLYFATMRSEHSGNVAKQTSRSDSQDSYLVRDREQRESQYMHERCL